MGPTPDDGSPGAGVGLTPVRPQAVEFEALPATGVAAGARCIWPLDRVLRQSRPSPAEKVTWPRVRGMELERAPGIVTGGREAGCGRAAPAPAPAALPCQNGNNSDKPRPIPAASGDGRLEFLDGPWWEARLGRGR